MPVGEKRNNMAKVAIVMAAYNGEKYIAEQITSILNNSYKDIELHICDDGSTDGTEEIVASFVERYPRKVFYHRNEKNLGVIRNFFFGLNLVEAEYYMFSDQDDVWEKDKILHTLEKMKEQEAKANSKPVLVFGDAYMVDSYLQSMGNTFQKISNLNPKDTRLSHVVVENAVIGCTVMLNEALKKKLTVFPKEIRMHDWWVALIAATMGELAFLDEPLLKYRQHGNNTLGGMSDMSFAKKNLGKIGKIRQGVHGSCYQAKAFLECYWDELTEQQRSVLAYFAEIPEKSWFVRKYRVIRGGYFKTGILKNMALLFVI